MNKVFLLNELEFKIPEISYFKLRKYKYIKSLHVFAARTKSFLLPSKIKHIQQLTLFKALLTSKTTPHVQKWFRTRFGSHCKLDDIKAPANRKQIRTLSECHIQYPDQIKALRYFQNINNLCIDLLFFSSSEPDFSLLDKFMTVLRRIKHIESICLLNNPPVFSESLLNSFLFLLTHLDNVGKVKLDITMELAGNNSFLQVLNQKKVQNLQVKYLGFDNLFWLNKPSFPENFSGLQELSLKIAELTDKQGMISFVTTNLQNLKLKALGLDISFKKCEKEYFKTFLESLHMPKTLCYIGFKFTEISFLDYFQKESAYMVEDNGGLSQNFVKAWGDLGKKLDSVTALDLTLHFSEQFKPSYADCVIEMVKYLTSLRTVRISIYDCYSYIRANQTLGKKRMFDFHAFSSNLLEHKHLKAIELSVPFVKFGDTKSKDNSYTGLFSSVEKVIVNYNTDPSPQENIEEFLSSLPVTIRELALRFCEIITDSDEIERRTLLISRFTSLEQLELTFQMKYMDKEIFLKFFQRLCQLNKLASLKVAFINLHLDQDTIQQVEQLFWWKARHMKLVKIRIHNALLVWEGRSFARKAPEVVR